MNHLIHFFELGSAVMVHSEMTDLERRENIRAFREGDKKYILACDLFNEGIDIPETNILVFMRSSNSRSIWLQQLGRGLRKTPNKDCVYIFDFVGSLDRIYAIKNLINTVRDYKFDKSDVNEESDKEYHDNSIDVVFSSEAAKVLDLLEHFKYVLNNKNNLISKLVEYFSEHNEIPELSFLEEKLSNVFLEQIYTIFNSYSEYISAALPENFDSLINYSDLFEYIESQISLYGHIPSIRAVQNYFTYQNLPKYSLQEIKEVLNKISNKNINPIYEAVLDENLIKNIPLATEIVHENSESDEYLEMFIDKIKCRSDLNNLSSEDRNKIVEKYKSVSIFLKKLKAYKS